MSKTDVILERFPGPVTLYASRRRKLGGLVLCVGFVIFFAWLLFAEYPETRGYRSGRYSQIMPWIAISFFGAQVIRLVVLLLAPRAASLTLDADGFEIGYVFRRERHSWRDVSDFRVETRSGKVGGSFKQIRYDLRSETPGLIGRELWPIYGSLARDDLANLVSAWRARALLKEPAV
jgi:hypothetical protein